MGKHFYKRWLWATALAFVFCAACPALLVADSPLRYGRNDPGDARPITVNADDIVTWVEQGKRIFLLKGQVQVQQDDASVRMPAAVVWVDEEAKKRTNIYRVEFYGEGGITFDLKPKTYNGPSGLFELNTRGDVQFKSFKNKVQEVALPQDPVYVRALALRANPPVAGQPARAPAAALPPLADTPLVANPQATAAARVDPALRQVGAQELPVPAVPGSQAPTAAATQVAQPPTIFPQPGLPGSPGSVGNPAMPGGPATVAPGQVGPPPPPPPPGAPQPPARVVTVQPAGPQAVPRILSIRPRSSQPLKIKEFPMPNEQKAIVLSPGVIISVSGTDATNKDMVDIEADRVVIWTRGDVRDLVEGAKTPEGQQSRQMEFYLSGNVDIRSKNLIFVGPPGPTGVRPTAYEERLLQCKECYYDVNRNVAIALDAVLDIRQPLLPDGLHVISPEIRQLSDKKFAMDTVSANASKLPFGPGVSIDMSQATLEQNKIEKRTIFGQAFTKRGTGEIEYEEQMLFRGTDVVTRIEDFPVFYLPFLQGDLRDPLGPLRSISVGYSQIFGFQFFSTFNVYDLIGIDPRPDSSWHLDLDYLSLRGPAIGMDYSERGKNLFDITNRYDLTIEARGMYDRGPDILGGGRGEDIVVGYPGPPEVIPITHPEWRGRFLEQLNVQDLPQGFTVQMQVSAISDKNYLDQYANPLFLNGLNQETYLYGKKQEDNWAITGLVEPRIRNWVTETEWLPKVDGYWIGQDFLDIFSYTARTSAGFAHLETAHVPPPPFEPTDFSDSTARIDLAQKLAIPFYAGPFKVVPYGTLDLTYYSEDIDKTDITRLIYGGGVMASIPFSHLYPDIRSELFNLNGIYHKIVLSANYIFEHSDVSHLMLPQLDRLNDDETDQTLRDIRQLQTSYNPANAAFLNSGFFDPQLYALRRLVDTSIDTLDSIEEVQLDLRQRWQTKRGFPGNEHIIDYITLDVQAAFFPQAGRDNFGETLGWVQYDFEWAVGDRTAIFSSGWFDPHQGGARVFNIGAQINRPDRTSFYLGYRQIDPLESKTVVAAVTLPFSEKYSVVASSAYDFGVNTQINALSVVRTGTDFQISLGFTYNSILSNFGFLFEIYPNLVPESRRTTGSLAGPVQQGH